MTNPFEEIRSRLDIRAVVEYYGVEIKRNNTCLCPFHNDHHPSAYVYPNAFHCFTCNVHYDVIGFVMELFGLSALDATKKLNDDFHLGISFGYEKKEYHKQKYSEEAHIREIQQKKRERFEMWEKDSWQTIHDYIWLLRDLYERYKPPITDSVPENYRLHPDFEYALVNLPHAEEFADMWITEFSGEDKIGSKSVVDKMRAFLDLHSEKPQKAENPKTGCSDMLSVCKALKAVN